MRWNNLLFLGLLWVLACAAAPSQELVPAPRLFPDLAFRLDVGDESARNPVSDTEGPKTVAAADLNGDTLPDLVIGNLDGSVSVLLGHKASGLLPQILVPATDMLEDSSLRAIAIADFNGDGKQDVAVGDIADEGIVVLFGSGDGRLTPAERTALGPVRALAAADFNLDGKMDLLAASSPPDCEWCGNTAPAEVNKSFLAVLKGNGNGTFQQPEYLIPPGVEVCFYDVEAADLDNDGRAEAVALDFNACYSADGVSRVRRIQVFKNHATTGFVANAPDKVLEPLGEGPRALHLAYLDEPTTLNDETARTLDIAVVNRDSATLDLFLNNGGLNFAAGVSYPAGDTPRDIAAGDLDADGKMDLVVVNRNKNTVSVLRGQGGGLFGAASGEFPTGMSPRQIALADFNGDGALDAAVNNRISEDVSFLEGTKGTAGFLLPASYYPAGITPMSVVAQDFNGDGFPDTATVGIRSHDLHVRLNTGQGKLGPATTYPVEFQPGFVVAGDVNSDGRTDLVVTTLSSSEESQGNGSLVTFLGRGDGTFQSPLSTPLGGRFRAPYWLRLGDLDNDSILDALVSGLHGELMAFRGNGNGTFNSPVLVRAGEGRPLGFALGDFDKNNRLDIATSRGLIILNDGQFFNPIANTEPAPSRLTHFEAGAQAWAIETDDLDGDGNLDLIVALTFVQPDPIGITFGKGDGSFGDITVYEGPDVGVVGMAVADVDSDGIKDIVIGNRCAGTVIVMRGVGERRFEYEQIIKTFSPEGVAVADMNKDQKPDIIGVGNGLWILLNGATSEWATAQDPVETPLPLRLGLFINEVMSSNREFHIVNGVTPDWVEIYNNSIDSVDMAGWTLMQMSGDKNTWTFPATGSVIIPRGGHMVIYFSRSLATENSTHPNFELSAEGVTVTLFRPSGVIEDSVSVPALPTDVSWARYTDGARFWGYNPTPTFRSRNRTPSNLDPTAERKDPYIGPGATTLGLNARFFDDVGVAYASVCFRLEGETAFQERTFNDDGLHGDKLPADGYYGTILPSLQPGQVLEYYLRVIDLEGESGTSPKNPELAARLHRITIPKPLPKLRLVEVLAANNNGQMDERGQREDWLELANFGQEPVLLDDLILSKDFYNKDTDWSFPANHWIAPGGRLIVFCDEDQFDGPFHASFKLQRTGDRVFLLQGTNRMIIDSLSFGALPNDATFGVLGAGVEGQLLGWPTPGQVNIAMPLSQQSSAVGPQLFSRAVPRVIGAGRSFDLRWLGPVAARYEVQISSDLRQWQSSPLSVVYLGEGLYEWSGLLEAGNQFYRVNLIP